MGFFMDLRSIIDISLITIIAIVTYWSYLQLLKKQLPRKTNNIDATFSISSINPCEIKNISFLIVIDSVKNNQIGVYLDLEVSGNYGSLFINTPIKFKTNIKIDTEKVKITGEENKTDIVISQKCKETSINKIKTIYTYGEMATSKDTSSCTYFFSLTDFTAKDSPYEKGEYLKFVAGEIYSPKIENMNIIFKNHCDNYQPTPEKSFPTPNSFLPQELRWHSSPEKDKHTSIYAVFTDNTMLDENKTRYFIHSIIFALSSSALVAVTLDLIWNIFKFIK